MVTRVAIKVAQVTNSQGYHCVSQVVVPGVRELKKRTWFFGKQEAGVMEVEDCREPLREGGRLMGGNRGTVEVRWNL